MPEVLAPYVEAGAYADCMRESHPADKEIAQTSMQQSVLADQEAKELLQMEIDVYMSMGKRHSYQQHRPPRRWIRNGLVQTPTWTAGSVTTLTDACDHDGMYPPPTVGPVANWEFHPEIVSLTTTSPTLAALTTSNRILGSAVEIIIPIPPSNTLVRQTWQVLAGAANPADSGQVVPLDYNATNPKRWVRVG